MAKSRRLEVLITGDAKQAQKALGDLERAAGKHGAGIQRASSGIKDAIVGIGVASVGAFALGEWQEAEKVGARTEAVLRSTGGAAGETRQEIEDLSEAIAKKTATDDETVQSAANVIASMQKLRNEAGEGRDIFDRSTQAAVDWAAATGGDAADAAEKLGKLLVNPEQALGRLTRAGVVFTDEEKKKLAALQATGDEIGQQVILLDAIERKVGGTAEAQATSLDRAKVAAGNAAEAFGGVLAPAVELVADVVEPLSGAFQSLGSTQQTVVAGLGLGAAAWMKWGDTAVEALIDVTGSSRDAEKAVSAVNGALGKAGVSVLAGVSAYNLTYQVLEDLAGAAPDVEKVADALNRFGQGVTDWDYVASTLGTNTEDLQGAFTRASKATADWSDSFAYMRDSMDPFGRKMYDAERKVNAFDEALAGMVEAGNASEAKAAFDAMSEALIAQGLTLTEIVPLMPKYYDAVEEAGAKNGLTATSIGVLTDALDAEADQAGGAAVQFRTLEEAIDGARSASEDFYRQQFEQENATIGAEASLDRFTESLTQYGAATDRGTEAGRANRQAIQDYIIAAASASAGTDDASASMDAYTLRLYEAAASAGMTKGDVDALLASMGLTEGERKAWFTSNAYEEQTKVQGLWTNVQGVEGTHDVTFRINTVDGLRQARDIIGGVFAEGGRPPMGKVSVVGEKGPELFVPDQPGTIIPNDKMGSFLAPSYSSMVGPGPNAAAAPVAPITIIVQGSVISERELVDVVADGLARRQRSTGNLGFGVPLRNLVGMSGL